MPSFRVYSFGRAHGKRNLFYSISGRRLRLMTIAAQSRVAYVRFGTPVEKKVLSERSGRN